MKNDSDWSIDKAFKIIGITLFVLCILFIPVLFIYYFEISIFIKEYSLAFSYIAAIGAFSSIVFSGYQTWMFKRQHYSNFEKEKIQKSIELADKYRSILEEDINFLLGYFKIVGLYDICNNHKYSDFSLFTTKELSSKFSQSQIVELQRLLEKLQFSDEKLYKIAYLYHANNKGIGDYYKSGIAKETHLRRMNFEGVIKSIFPTKKNKITEQDKIVSTIKTNITNKVNVEISAIQYDINIRMYRVLNELEWFAMHFKNGIADERVLYQSLHQSYLEFVRIIYFKISNLNTDTKSRSYSNVIWLYNKWAAQFDLEYLE